MGLDTTRERSGMHCVSDGGYSTRAGCNTVFFMFFYRPAEQKMARAEGKTSIVYQLYRTYKSSKGE